MTDVTFRRTGKPVKAGGSVSVVLTKELDFLGINEGDDIVISIIDKKIIIEPADYYAAFRKDVKQV